MKIEITSAPNETSWYADKIGEQFDVICVESFGYVVRDEGVERYFVRKEDCKIITKN
jgi:hypothetical protein